MHTQWPCAHTFVDHGGVHGSGFPLLFFIIGDNVAVASQNQGGSPPGRYLSQFTGSYYSNIVFVNHFGAAACIMARLATGGPAARRRCGFVTVNAESGSSTSNKSNLDPHTVHQATPKRARNDKLGLEPDVWITPSETSFGRGLQRGVSPECPKTWVTRTTTNSDPGVSF